MTNPGEGEKLRSSLAQCDGNSDLLYKLWGEATASANSSARSAGQLFDLADKLLHWHRIHLEENAGLRAEITALRKAVYEAYEELSGGPTFSGHRVGYEEHQLTAGFAAAWRLKPEVLYAVEQVRREAKLRQK